MNKLLSIFSIILFMTISHKASSYQNLDCNILLSSFLNKPSYYEEEVRSRLESMECLVSTKIEDDVLDQVKRFVGRNKATTLEILKRTEIYFPLIDKIFNEYNLPTDLKYITIVESALLLDAKSHVGAAGIWQLMPATARILKLRVDDKVDQRLDPVLATHAAARYFKLLFTMFNDWSLVIAAYNCGEYKVKDLVESSNATDFWGLKKYLPRQTQLFVPAFIGVSYMMQFHMEHDILPKNQDLFVEKITFAKIFNEVSLKDLFKKTNIRKDIFMSLNPSYKRMVIPTMSFGSSVSLPDSLMVEFIDYYMFQNKKNSFLDEARILLSGDGLLDHEIISFNRPFIFAPDNIALQQANTRSLEFESNSVKDIRELPSVSTTNAFEYQYHIVKSRESISEIAENYKVNIEDLISWNQVDLSQVLRIGNVLKIKTQ
ncbi:MAG: transglycosylase SLT domain-containing protein [Saprospiraceae bacterium]|nr:transglycosylase SLT domain-containing protein [Saprospiraceae bacterium]MBK8450548.1 transglycosylase SLT domain-containing protein [Saprospiraceae bacterium]MBK9222587.1 transglycosylase SLT domain-containing protein [Saprospiraceae bacterium]MBK9720380.1 transglycosylase SLT domain-containing protein [Saprospiraceae bacterium]MBK9727350.1 transglycosylase SLT domain-containing protein [Saprospiraceae bacterium]